MNMKNYASQQANLWAQKKQEMQERAERLKAERKANLAYNGERAIGNSIGI